MSRKYVLVALACVALAGNVHAQAVEPAPPPAATQTRPEAPPEPKVVPIEVAAGKVYIDVMVNGKGPFCFALDTGAPPTVIDLDLAKELGLQSLQMGEIGGAGEGSAAMGMIGEVTLEFGGLSIKRKQMAAVDLTGTVSQVGGRKIRGLIGNDWVTSRVVEIDYAHHTMRVWPSQGWEYKGQGTIVPTRLRGYTFVEGKVKLAGEDGEELPVRLFVDSGGGVSITLNTPFVNKHDLLTKAQPRLKATVGHGLGGDVKHDVCRLARLTLGDLVVDQPICTLSQDKAGALSQASYDGIIGSEILTRYTVIFDGARRRMIFEPNESAKSLMQFDMSGIMLAGGGGEGPLKVYRVVDGSPASEAGLAEGDEVLEIDGKPVRGSDRDQARDLFKEDGRERVLKIKRADDVREVTIKLRKMVRGQSGQAAAC